MDHGTLTLVFDDGYVEDYETVRPVLAERDVPASLAINPATLGEPGMLTTGQLEELVESGWEVLSHGRRHRYMQAHPLAADAAAGERTVELDSGHVFPEDDHGVYPGERLEVTDGRTTETHVVAEKGTREGAATVTFESALGTEFSVDESVARLPEDLLHEEIVGVRTDFEALDLDPSGFVLPYDAADARAWSLLVDHYEALTYTVSARPNPPDASPLALERYYLQTGHMRPAEIDAYLDAIAESGGLGILAGHSSWDVVTADRLAYVVEGALDRGIEVTTLEAAVGARQ